METINREHPEYVARKATWKQYRDLYAGGEQFRSFGSLYLVRRLKEPGEIYLERLARAFYQNYVGSIIDWYSATLMRCAPGLLFRGSDSAAEDFYSTLYGDCDLKGTSLAEFFRQRFVEMLVCGSSFVVVDFPKVGEEATSRAEEDASGRSRAYLMDYGPEEVINWSHDRLGGLEWVVLRTSCLQQSSITDAQWQKETRWIYYDRQNFQIYRKRGESEAIELIDEGRHGLASVGRVPVFELRVSEGLWLMNKSATLQLEHFNKSNALAWALTMGLFASPVIYSDNEWKGVVGESYYIKLGKDDRFGWTEPEGKVYQIAADNLVNLRDEIYRVCYLMIQAGESGSGGHQSAVSKQLDFATTEEVLRAYGGIVKETMKQVLQAVAAARQDEVAIEISGMDEFDINDLGTDLDDAQKLLALGVESKTLRKEIFKRLALKYLSDASQETKNRVAAEIESGE